MDKAKTATAVFAKPKNSGRGYPDEDDHAE